MPWKEKGLRIMREEFVQRVLAKEKSKSALCREYGISRPTGDKWLKRYANGESLSDKSRAPKHPQRCYEELESEIVARRQNHPAIGAVKLRKIMENEGWDNLPCAKTFNNIFHRYGLITKEASAAATPYQRFVRDQPNQLWQGDFKGDFPLDNGERCHTLNIIDDHSRFNLCTEPLPAETFEVVQPIMIRLFREHGLPDAFLCDHGNPWGSSTIVGYTRFEVWLMEQGVLTLHGRPLHPQTQGKEERYNGSFTRECLREQRFLNFEDAKAKFDAYRAFYNNVRPHHALNMDVPAHHYFRSPKEYREIIEPWEYPDGYERRKVSNRGFILYKGEKFYLSEAFNCKEIGIRPSHIPGQITIAFRQFRIARIDLKTKKFTLRRASIMERQT